MLNFRFHIVSLVAVFLALAIGIIMGSTVIDRALVDTLEDQQQTLRADIDDLTDANAALRQELRELRDRSERLASEGGERLLAGTLRDVPVLLMAVRGVDGSMLDDLRELLVTAGASDQGTLWLTDRFLLEDEDAVARLADVLDASPAAGAAELRAAAIEAVATAVRDGVAVPTGQPDGPGVVPPYDGGDGPAEEPAGGGEALGIVTALREAGFVDYDAPPEGSDEVAEIVDPGTRVVLVAGTAADVADRDLGVPLARALVDQGAAGAPTVPLLAAEAQPGEDVDPEDEGPGFVSLLREDDAADRLSTVDNLDTFAGRLATVVALQDLGAGRRGHYGVGPGAERLVPARVE